MMGRNCLKTDATSIGLISATSTAVAVLAAAAAKDQIGNHNYDRGNYLQRPATVTAMFYIHGWANSSAANLLSYWQPH